MKIEDNKVKLYFEKNKGQLPIDVKFKVESKGYSSFFTEDKLVISLPSNIEDTINVFYMKLENRNKSVEVKGEDKELGVVNYFIGTDKSKWITNIETYSRITYKDVYENIDLYYYINNYNIEYDFVLSKGANAKDISISFEGVDNIEIDQDKNVVLSIGDAFAKLLKPKVYQIIDNVKKFIDCEYRLDENNCINFLLDNYEEEYELVLDPVIVLDSSTYIGGDYSDYTYSIDTDINQNIYITGKTMGHYPTTAGAYQTNFKGNYDVFVTKFSRDQKSLVYSTYIGGSKSDSGIGIKVDSIGCAYIVGQTSGNYPTTEGAYKTTAGGNNDVFVTKLSRDGSDLIYSTYIGGSGHDYVRGMDLDMDSCVYIVGYTSGNYPTTESAYQVTYGGGASDIFISKLNKYGSDLIYSTYIGGSGNDYGYAMCVDSEGYAYITGSTSSSNYPTTAGAIQVSLGGNTDVFVSKIGKDGKSLMYSTYLGGISDDYGYGIDIDSEGCAYVSGTTFSNNYPITSGAYRTTYLLSEAFVSKISKDGKSLIYSTYIGGSSSDMGSGIKVDSNGYSHVVGQTQSIDYPTTKDAYQNTSGGGIYDSFYSVLNGVGNGLIYSTYLGGNGADVAYAVEIDNIGGVYIAGNTQSTNYPTIKDAYQTELKGSYDAFITKISSLDFEIRWRYSKSKVKLLDTVTVSLTVINTGSTNSDINLKAIYIDSSVLFVPNSLCIQGVIQSSTLIPEDIYISNVLSKESIDISFDLKYITEVFPEKIPIVVEVESYTNKTGSLILSKSIVKHIYIDTTVGVNFIPGCTPLYNLEVNGKLQMTDGGMPIVYYKSENSYIYREPKESSYVYSVLENPSDVVEHKMN